MNSIVLVVVSCVLTAAGQVAFKYGMQEFEHLEFKMNQLHHTLLQIFMTPSIILGFTSFGAGAVLWLFVLAKLDVSYAVPVGSLTYIFVLIAGIMIFKEPVTAYKIMGTTLIMAGIVVISLK